MEPNASNGLQTDAQIQKRPPYRSAAMIVDNSLHDDDVDSLKFLCQGLVVASKLKRVDTAIELLNLLESANLVSESDFFLLADLLQYIQRIDVLQNIGYDEREVMFHRHQQGSKVDPFFVLLFQIAEELPDEDVKKAGYMYGKVPRAHKLSSGKDLFSIMVQHMVIAPGNVALLKNIFQSIERQDVVEIIDRYTATQGRSVMEDLEQSFARAMSLRGITVGNFGDMLDRVHTQQDPVEPAPQLPSQFGSGMGPSIHDNDVGHNEYRRQFSIPCPASDHFSTINNPPSHPPLDPSAPPPSLPSFHQRDPPSVHPAHSYQAPDPYPQPAPATAAVNPAFVQAPVTVAPEGFDNYDIPWRILEILSTKIPAVYWPELSKNLGVPVTSQWSNTSTDSNHCLAVLRRWLELPETRTLDPVGVKIMLVKALAAAGPSLMAQEIANELNIDFQAVMRDSASSGLSSNFDENDVASTGSAIPESQANQPPSMGNVEVAPVTRQMQQLNLYPGPIPYYKMDRIPRGICLIINNRNFYKDPNKVESKQMISREGTDVDRDKLQVTFEALGFHVVLRDNLRDSEMIQVVQSMAACDHADFDCFVCCVLTHGVQGALYGVNGMTVPIRDLTAPFRSQACPSLSDKPKLFFMQACQGRDKQEGHMRDIQTDAAVPMESDSPPELIPNESDFLLGYATVPGFVSYRSKTRGSWYITKLTELLNKYAYDHDIHDILTLVNYEVGRGDALIEGGQYKQSPAPMYSLRKKLIFVNPPCRD